MSLSISLLATPTELLMMGTVTLSRIYVPGVDWGLMFGIDEGLERPFKVGEPVPYKTPVNTLHIAT